MEGRGREQRLVPQEMLSVGEGSLFRAMDDMAESKPQIQKGKNKIS